MLQKPQTKHPGYLCEAFSNEMCMEFEELEQRLSESDSKDLVDIIHRAYKEGYLDGWEMHSFFSAKHCDS